MSNELVHYKTVMSSDIVEALNHIYFGDEACKSIVLDGWNELIAFQITRVVKFEGSTWSPGVGEEICDAYMVFTGATAITFDPPGFLPNDLMNDISATRDEGKTSYRVTASIDCVLECGNRQEVVIAFNADGLSVEKYYGTQRP